MDRDSHFCIIKKEKENNFLIFSECLKLTYLNASYDCFLTIQAYKKYKKAYFIVRVIPNKNILSLTKTV